MSARGEYGKQDDGHSTAATTAALVLVVAGVLLAPVIAIVGATALAVAVSGRGGKG